MGFVLDGLDTESYDRQYSDKELTARIAGYFAKHKKKLIFVVIALVLNSAAGSVAPVLISTAIDMISGSPTVPLMLIFASSVMGVGGLGWLFNYIRQKFTAEITGDVVLNLREEVFRKTIGQDLSFYDEHASGRIVSRITSDTRDFSQVINLVVDLLSQFLLVVILIFILFFIDLFLGLVMVGMIPFATLIALGFRKIARKVTRKSKRVTAKINAQIQESVSGIMVAKSFRKEKSLYNQFIQGNEQAYHVGFRRGVTFNSIFPVIGVASGLGTALVMFLAAQSVLNHQMSPGSWYLFMQTVVFFWWPVLNIASFWSQFQDGLSAAERVFALIDRQSVVKQVDNLSPEKLKGGLQFENVTFAYNEKETVLNNFSLNIKPGETVALVGHTGAGKSSIARLITRFYEFQKGQILVDGNDIRSLDLGAYRSRIGLVPQDPFLFSGTVADNICYGSNRCATEEILYAATHIGDGDWIDDLSNGLETDVGHRGSSLSMGQRQLVALSRILLKDPAIFILDEATASVDPFIEVQIQEGLEAVMEHRTAIIIAHRLSTVKKADRILVMEDGQIVEEGNHEQLLMSGGRYASLYNTYFRHQSLEYVEKQYKEI